MTMLSTPAEELRSRVAGDVHLPGDDGYDEATLSWNRLYQHRPAIIGLPASVADVVELVRFASAHGLAIGVQTTGHGPVLPVDGGMLIKTGRIGSLEIDPVAQTAKVGAGLTWGPVLTAAQDHGLTPLLGSSTGVGAVGYTLGGGFGWLGRRYGMASDSVRSFDVVTTDGRLLTVSADEHADLFWALRGGGAGSIAVVTSMEISLYPVTTAYAGNLYYPAESAGEVMRRWREWTATAPAELTSSVVLMNYPPFDEVPEQLRGQSFVLVRGCHSGSDGERALAFWREWKTPLMDMWGEIPFTQADTISNDPTEP
ncbi:MAG TPA: FAD-binding oxidoreductase, partial [Acidimicrobiia bacterium]|nr:FAD-binding oxidoreductase [Acidimicrobiia bacterium]